MGGKPFETTRAHREFLVEASAIASEVIDASRPGGLLSGVRPSDDASAQKQKPADTVLINGRIATLDARCRSVSALAIRGERIIAAGSEAEIAPLRGPATRVIDVCGHTVVPGLEDAHTHFIRGGLTYSIEVRWDGVPSLAEALQRVREQARRTPPPHWVQVIGGWTAAQFAERRFPTLDEINAATGDTPAMIMHLYDRAWLNRAALRTLGWTRDTPHPMGGTIERDASGHPTGVVAATAGLIALLGIWLRIPRLSPEEQILSTRHFMREHNRLGITSVIDAGGGGQNYPDNYRAIGELAARNEMTLRIGYTLFAQTPGKELDDFRAWSKKVRLGQGTDWYRMIGAGEYILHALADVTNFAKEPVTIAPVMENELAKIGEYLAQLRWPFRMHATFDATAQRALRVLERVNREVPLAGLRWGFDHCETVTPATLERIAALDGTVNIQNRMSLDGEAFIAKYGDHLASDAPPIARIRATGVPLAAGTDGNRATSYNPWIGVHWLITGRTLGGIRHQAERNLLDRTEALRLYTAGGAWMSHEESSKGTLEAGKLADLVVLSADYFTIPVDEIRDLESVLTVVGGKVVYADGPFSSLAPPELPTCAEWLPISRYGTYYRKSGTHLPQSGEQHAHRVVIGEAGHWSPDCSCGAL